MADTGRRTETMVGFFLFVGLALLGFLVMQYGRLADRFRGVYTVEVSFSDAAGLIKGSQVRLSGAKVGQVVTEPQLTEDGRVLVELAIRNDTPTIDRNATFQITSLSLLGDKAIMITPPPPDKASGIALDDGDLLEGGGPSGLEAIQTDAQTIASEAVVLMARGRTTLTKIDNALDELRSVTGLLTESVDTINHGLLSQENLDNFGGALADMRGATGNIKEASAEIAPVIADAKATLASFDLAAQEAQGTFARASSEISKLSPALEQVPDAVSSIVKVADNANETLESVKKSEGLLGTLAYDREVKDDARTFLRNLRHYGVLRYKDDETYDERDPRNRFRGRRR